MLAGVTWTEPVDAKRARYSDQTSISWYLDNLDIAIAALGATRQKSNQLADFIHDYVISLVESCFLDSRFQQSFAIVHLVLTLYQSKGR